MQTAARPAEKAAIMNSERTSASSLPLLQQQIHEYITTNFLYDGSSAPLDDTLSLFEASIVDPTGLLEIVLFLEESYGIVVDEADLTPENFDTVELIARYALHRLADE